jgi:hypothetical protein
MDRMKPDKIRGIKIGGEIADSRKNEWFAIDFKPRNRDLREELEELRPRFQKVENGKYKYFKSPFRGSKVHLIYLNWESAKGLYKNPENNLPYEIFNSTGSLIYRQSIIEKKEEIFNNLEKLAVEEGLR